MVNKTLNIFAGILVGTAAATIGYSANAQDFYAGKTLRVVINSAPGAATDAGARLFAPYWQQHIPGNPEIIVENLSGGLIAGVNQFGERMAADGLTASWMAWPALTQAIGDPALRVDLSTFEPIGASTVPVVMYGRTDTNPPIENPADIVNAQDVRLGGLSPNSSIDLRARLSLDVLGVNYNYITGYPGGSGVHAALMSGEVHLNLAALNSYRSTYEPAVVSTGDAIGYYYIALSGGDGELVLDPNIPEMPALHELYEEIHGELPSGEHWDVLQFVNGFVSDVQWPVFLPEGAPAEAVEALRVGFEAARNDPTYLSEAERIFGVPPVFRTAEELDAVAQRLNDLDPDAIAFLQQYIAESQR